MSWQQFQLKLTKTSQTTCMDSVSMVTRGHSIWLFLTDGLINRLFAHDTMSLQCCSVNCRWGTDSDFQQVTHSVKNAMVCIIYGCSNLLNRETTRSFYWVPKVVVHKKEKCKTLTKKLWKNVSWAFVCSREEQSRIMLHLPRLHWPFRVVTNKLP